MGLLIVVAAATGYVLVSAPPPAEQAGERELAMALPVNDAATADRTTAEAQAAAAPRTAPETAPKATTPEATTPEATTPAAEPAAAAAPEPQSEAAAQPQTEPIVASQPEPEAAAPAEPPPAPAESAAPETPQQQAALPARAEAEAPSAAAPADETAPWRRNSQAFAADDTRPRIAVVLTSLGLSSAATEAAIKQLPPEITLSFTPYARRLNQWIALARASGHEVMLDLPMEPTSYPNDDPGPQALLTALSARQNLERLDWTLSRGSGFVGVVAVMGSRFAASPDDLEPVLEELKARGFMYLDNHASDDSVAGALAMKIGLPVAVNDRTLDQAQASHVAIDARLVQLENIAAAEGSAVAIGEPYPVTIERLRVWSKDLGQRGFVLAPITAVANRQKQHQQAADRAAGE